MKLKTRLLRGFGVLICLFLFCVGMLWYRTEYRQERVLQSVSPGGAANLTIYAAGEPNFPYGAAHGTMVLWRDIEILRQIPFEVHDDGAQMTQANFHIVWSDKTVTVTISGSEQEDAVWVLDYGNGGLLTSPDE